MRAVVLKEFGSPDRLVPVDMPDPVPGAGEVLVDVEVAGITFVETQIRAGRPPHPAMTPALPVVLGNGVGGAVAAVGPGVDASLIGRRVVTTLGGSGGYAERAAAPAAALIEVPEGVGLADAVALLADGRTALLALRATNPAPGETALVLAAGGGVGSLLVQLVRRAGARVVAAAGGERKLDLARSLGAETTVDYTSDGWTAALAPVDVVVDGVGGAIGRSAFERLRPGGRLLRLGAASGAFAGVTDDEAAVRGVALVGDGPPDPEALRALAREALELAAQGRLRPTVGQTFTLEEAAAAHATIEARAALGKTLLVTR